MEERHAAAAAASPDGRDACGCEVGGIAASVALIAYVAFLFLARGAPPAWQLRDLAWGAAVVLGAALGGKALGIMRARGRQGAD